MSLKLRLIFHINVDIFTIRPGLSLTSLLSPIISSHPNSIKPQGNPVWLDFAVFKKECYA
jgi:hypothetical protein